MGNLTRFPRESSIPMLPALPPNLAYTRGRVWHVAPYSGDDDVDGAGKSDRKPFKTLAAAKAAATADQNDIVLLYAESNTPGKTTDYLTETLVWDKDGVHLIGVCAGGPYNKRSRVAWKSDAASGSDIPLFTLSANDCYIANVSFAVGSADANLSFGVKITGDRNKLAGVDIPMPTNAANDVAGAYALKLDGCDETEFDDCVLGSFTIDMGAAANQLLLVDGGCSLVKFRRTDFIQRIKSNTNSPAVRFADAGAVGFGCLWFEDHCHFITTAVSGGYTQAGAFKTVAAQNDGRVIMDATCHTNALKWDADDLDNIWLAGAVVPADDTSGRMRAV